MGIWGIRNPNMRIITLKNADGTVSGTISVSKTKPKKRKKSGYHLTEVSNLIIRSKTSGRAGLAVIKARSTVAMLKRKLKTGDYDENDLKYAILHAEQMERVARKKKKHLEEEENAKLRCGEYPGDIKDMEASEEVTSEPEDLEGMKLEEKIQMLEDMLQDMENEMQSFDEFSEMFDDLFMKTYDDIEPADLERLKKKHRSEEMRDIMLANVKYLRAMFEKMDSDRKNGVQGVSLELGGMDIPVTPPPEPVCAEGMNMDISV